MTIIHPIRPRGVATGNRPGAVGRTAPWSPHPFLSGMLEALLLPLAFVALGLGWWGTLLQTEGPPSAYPRSLLESVSVSRTESPVWLVDGFNVVQVGLLGGQDRSAWWTGERRALLLARVEALEPLEAPVWVVFDGGSPLREPDEGARARVVFTPSADQWLVDRVRKAEDPHRLVVVTADRRLAARVRHHGARVESPGEFLTRCRIDSERGYITSI